MTSMIGTTEVLKQDARGRVRVPPERRKALLEEFENSGLSAAKFARLAGIKYATFANWVQKRRQERGALSSNANDAAASGSVTAPVRLFEALVEGAPCGTRLAAAVAHGLVVELPGGARMILDSPIQLQMAAELLALFAQRASTRC